MTIKEYDKFGTATFRGQEYILTGIEDTESLKLAVSAKARPNRDGYYPAKWVEVDPLSPRMILSVLRETDCWTYFNPTDESVEVAQA